MCICLCWIFAIPGLVWGIRAYSRCGRLQRYDSRRHRPRRRGRDPEAYLEQIRRDLRKSMIAFFVSICLLIVLVPSRVDLLTYFALGLSCSYITYCCYVSPYL
ncbi:MAG: hypothetical protein MHM6MM_000920 [Cercozoa sp. M6MM]